jgi:hypothetical protein
VLVADLPVLARRWYVVLAGVLAVLALCWGAAVLVPAQHEVTSTVLMLPPPTIVDGKPANPYTNLGGLDGISDVLGTALEDSSVEEAIQEAGFEAEYTVERDPNRASPVIVLNVLGVSPEDALSAQAFLLDHLPLTLDQLQEAVGVDTPARITSTIVTEDETTQPNRKSQIRAVLVIAVIGLGGTYLAASVLDGVLLGRRGPIRGRTNPRSPVAGGQAEIPAAPARPRSIGP